MQTQTFLHKVNKLEIRIVEKIKSFKKFGN